MKTRKTPKNKKYFLNDKWFSTFFNSDIALCSTSLLFLYPYSIDWNSSLILTETQNPS